MIITSIVTEVMIHIFGDCRLAMIWPRKLLTCYFRRPTTDRRTWTSSNYTTVSRPMSSSVTKLLDCVHLERQESWLILEITHMEASMLSTLVEVLFPRDILLVPQASTYISCFRSIWKFFSGMFSSIVHVHSIPGSTFHDFELYCILFGVLLHNRAVQIKLWQWMGCCVLKHKHINISLNSSWMLLAVRLGFPSQQCQRLVSLALHPDWSLWPLIVIYSEWRHTSSSCG